MMRVLFAPFSTTPHVYNAVPLAWAMQTAGHEVRVAGHPDVTDRITEAGLTAISVGAELDIRGAIDASPPPDGDFADAIDDSCGLALSEDTQRGRALRMRFLGTLSMYFCADFPTGRHESAVNDLVAFTGSWRPDLVIWDPLNVPAGVAAHVAGCAHARMPFAMDFAGHMRTTFLDRNPLRGADEVTRWLSESLGSYGCEFDEQVLLGQWTIDPMPSWLRLPVELPRVPVRKIPYNGVSPVPRWLFAPPRKPRICLSLGISQREVWGRDGEMLNILLDALSELDVEVVATLSVRQQKSLRLPDNVRAVEYVPLDALLPTCSVIVHHGGPGTYGNAVAHGVPQLIVPLQLWDEERVAELVQQRGAGLMIHPDQLRPDFARHALRRLLDAPSFFAEAAAVRRELLATPSPNEIVPVLERLTAASAAQAS